MKKNGFTLIELLVTVALILAIALLVVPKVQTLIDENKEKAYQSMLKTIEDAAQSYVYLNTNEVDNAIETNGYAEVTILKLQEEDLLSVDIKNPKTDENVSNSSVVKITKEGASYIYELSSNESE